MSEKSFSLMSEKSFSQGKDEMHLTLKMRKRVLELGKKEKVQGKPTKKMLKLKQRRALLDS